MSMEEWAKHEIELACKREAPDRKDGEWDYGCACYESALKAFLSLLEDGHSGLSFGITRGILIRLMKGLPLIPIEDIEETWNLCCEFKDGTKEYQCKRMSSLFKRVAADGTVNFSANNYHCVDEENGITYTGGGAYDILTYYIGPITMPYFPPDKDYVIHTLECLSDKNNGDFDTKAYLYIECPDGKRIDVYRYFAETKGGWREVQAEEFDRRWTMDKTKKDTSLHTLVNWKGRKTSNLDDLRAWIKKCDDDEYTHPGYISVKRLLAKLDKMSPEGDGDFSRYMNPPEDDEISG